MNAPAEPGFAEPKPVKVLGAENIGAGLALSKDKDGWAVLLLAEPKAGVEFGAPKLNPDEEDGCEGRKEGVGNEEAWFPNAKLFFAGPFVTGAEAPKVKTLALDD